MLNFELRLEKLLVELCNEISSLLINQASEDLAVSLKKQAYTKGGRKIAVRPLRFRLRTGHIVQTKGLYVKKLADQAQWLGSRHLLENHWTIILSFMVFESKSYKLSDKKLDTKVMFSTIYFYKTFRTG